METVEENTNGDNVLRFFIKQRNSGSKYRKEIVELILSDYMNYFPALASLITNLGQENKDFAIAMTRTFLGKKP